MAVTAFASADADPVANPNVDATVLQADLPVGSVQLYGAAQDSLDASPVWVWSWTILAKPSGSSASLSSATAQNPTLDDVDVWGNYLVHLVATNTDNGNAQSESDPTAAPTSSFVVVRVTSTSRTLQKPAPGERGWHTQYHDLVDEVDGIASTVGAHNIEDHADVTDATGADLEALTSGGYADDPDLLNPNPGARLHKHKGGDVDAATLAGRGTVLLSAPPLDAAAPKAITRERLTFTAHLPEMNPDNSPPHLAFYVADSNVVVDHLAVAMADGGSTGSGVAPLYDLELHEATEANIAAGSTGSLITDGGGVPVNAEILNIRAASNGAPVAAKSSSSLNLSVTADRYIVAVFSTADPRTAEAQGVTLTVVCHRRV